MYGPNDDTDGIVDDDAYWDWDDPDNDYPDPSVQPGL